MQSIEFDLPVGDLEKYSLEGNYIAYFRATSGADYPELRVRTNNGDDFLLRPGDSARLAKIANSWTLTNSEGINQIIGKVMIGADVRFVSNRVEGVITVQTQVQGSVITNVAEKTIGTSEGLAAAASAARRSVRFFAPDTNTDTIWLGATGITALNGCAFVKPGQTWVESDGAAGAWYGISGTAGQKLRVQEIA